MGGAVITRAHARSCDVRLARGVSLAFRSCEPFTWCRMGGTSHRRPKRVRLATVLPFTAGVFLGTLITLFLVLALRSIDDETSYSLALSTGGEVMPSMPRTPRVHATTHSVTHETTRKELVSYSVVVHKSELKTRGLAAHKTWSSELGKRVNFYIFPPGTDDDINFAYKRRMPLVSLGSMQRGSWTSSNTQSNSHRVIRTLLDVCQRDLGKYQWYAKIDDTTYVRHKELEGILVKLNSSEPHFIGHRVLPEGREREELGLREGEGYCMEMGYVMSLRTLQLVCPMLPYCQENARSENNDVELARCVRLATGINCTASQEVTYTVDTLIQHTLK